MSRNDAELAILIAAIRDRCQTPIAELLTGRGNKPRRLDQRI
jgi:hypothetical protein